MNEGNMCIIGQFVGSTDRFIDLLLLDVKYKYRDKRSTNIVERIRSSWENKIDIVIRSVGYATARM